MWTPNVFRGVGVGMAAGSLAAGVMSGPVTGAACALVTAGYWKIGLDDLSQTQHTIRRSRVFTFYLP